MDIGLALTYITKDPDWIKKVLIGGLVLLVSSLFSILIVGLLGFLIFYGYGIRTIRNVLNGVEHPLPEWDDFGGDLTRGLKAVVGAIVWAIPVWVLGACVAIVSAAGGDAANLIASIAQFCLITPLSLLLGIFVMPTVVGRFAETDEISPMLQFGEVISEIRGTGVAPYLLYFVLTIIAGIVGALGMVACIIGVVFTLAYAQYATFHGIAQVRMQTRNQIAPVAQPNHPAF